MGKWKDELQSLLFWRAVAAECLGSFMLIFFCCASGTVWDPENRPSVVQLSLTAGLNVATIIWCIHGVSGAHINPALTLPLLLTRKVTVVRAFLYMSAHFVGALIAVGTLKVITPVQFRGTLALNRLHEGVTPVGGCLLEAMMTFVLVFTVFATIDHKRTDLVTLKGSGPLAIGLSAGMVHLAGIKYTGCSLNPARTLAPAVFQGVWDDSHWVYWVGPMLGGAVAGLVYEYIFAARAPIILSEIEANESHRKNNRLSINDQEIISCMELNTLE